MEVTKIGKYPLIEYLGSWSEQVPLEPGVLTGPYTSYGVRLGVTGILNIKEALENNKDFKVTDYISQELRKSFNFYKVTLVADFSHGSNLKFDSGEVMVKLANDSSNINPYVYSISPVEVNEPTKVNKKFGLSPSLELFEIKLNPGISYITEREYEELHPKIKGHFNAAQDASWQYMTTPGVDDIIGVQLVEFVVKQPQNTKTTWKASPDGAFKWASFKDTVMAFFRRKKKPEVEQTFHTFDIPHS